MNYKEDATAKFMTEKNSKISRINLCSSDDKKKNSKKNLKVREK